MIAGAEYVLGRYLLAMLFALGAVQKIANPAAVQTLLNNLNLPEWLVWPAMAFNAVAAILLVVDRHIRLTARLLALYCVGTSFFHLVPSDPWQMSIFVKNWAISGGLLILASHASGRSRNPACTRESE